MLRINIHTQPIRLEYNLQNAKLNLQAIPPKLEMETIPPRLEIRQPRGELTIDNTAYRYSIGLKNIADFASDNAELGRQTAMETIARIVDEGNQMAQIEINYNPIGEMAFEAGIQDAPDLTLATTASPEIRYQANPPEINVIDGKVNYSLQRGRVDGEYVPGSVDIRVIQYPSVEYSIIDVKV